MTTQYLRQLSLVVANAAGQGVELGSFRVVFRVQRGDTNTPNACDVRIYNLTDDEANSLLQTQTPEFTQLVLKAGYQSQTLGLLFSGSIKQTRKGREDQRNSYLDITAADGDAAYNYSATALSLVASQNTPKNAIEQIVQRMAGVAIGSPIGGGNGQTVSMGYTPSTLNPNPGVRGRVYYGDSVDALTEIAEANDCTWSIQNGQVVFIPKTTYLPDEAIVISPLTGLIGVPEQTQNGLTMRVLLNASIKIGQRVQLIAPAINQLRYGLDANSQALASLQKTSETKINLQGMYYVMRADHQGDTRGIPWYTDLVCLAVDATQPVTSGVGQTIGPVTTVPPPNAIPQY